MPAFDSACVISSRPDFANWSGKNPRFPTITPIVIFFSGIRFFFVAELSHLGVTGRPRALPCRRKVQAKKCAKQQQHATPPDVGVQVIEHNLSYWWRHQLVNP